MMRGEIGVRHCYMCLGEGREANVGAVAVQEAQEPVACQNPREEWERSVVEIVESGREDVRRKKRGRIAEWRRVRVDSRVDKKSTGREQETQRRQKDRERVKERPEWSRTCSCRPRKEVTDGGGWRREEKKRRRRRQGWRKEEPNREKEMIEIHTRKRERESVNVFLWEQIDCGSEREREKRKRGLRLTRENKE